MTSRVCISQYTPWIVLISALWAQVFYSASYGWLHGEYYDYGWYVPPLAVWFFYRKWREWKTLPHASLPGWAITLGILFLTAILVALRIMGRTDPGWPWPGWGQAIIACIITCYIVWKKAGNLAITRIVPVLLFALTSVRLPGRVEKLLVDSMTHGVLDASSWIFRVLGHAVTVMGNQLEMAGKIVEVTEGCSGIRSAQSFLMASLCFGEWLRLEAKWRISLVGAALLIAWVMNVARACLLAEIRFNQGESAFERAHNPVGIAAFVIGTGIVFWLAFMLDAKRKGIRLVRHKVGGDCA